jgi:hypothetical protein
MSNLSFMGTAGGTLIHGHSMVQHAPPRSTASLYVLAAIYREICRQAPVPGGKPSARLCNGVNRAATQAMHDTCPDCGPHLYIATGQRRFDVVGSPVGWPQPTGAAGSTAESIHRINFALSRLSRCAGRAREQDERHRDDG